MGRRRNASIKTRCRHFSLKAKPHSHKALLAKTRATQFGLLIAGLETSIGSTRARASEQSKRRTSLDRIGVRVSKPETEQTTQIERIRAECGEGNPQISPLAQILGLLLAHRCAEHRRRDPRGRLRRKHHDPHTKSAASRAGTQM